MVVVFDDTLYADVISDGMCVDSCVLYKKPASTVAMNINNHDGAQHTDLASALLHIEILQLMLAEKNAELSEVRKREEVYATLHEWVALGKISSPGPDVLNRMSELRASMKAFSEAVLSDGVGLG